MKRQDQIQEGEPESSLKLGLESQREGALRIAVNPEVCSSVHSFGNKLARFLWGVVWRCMFRPTPRSCDGWRRFLLRCFGAKIGRGARVLPSARIWAPWNLEMGDYSCLSFDTDCYCVAPIRIGAHATVSQYSFLCSATHDESDPNMRLVAKPIVIGDQAWIAADVFVAPGVHVGEGAVVGARSSVFRDLPPWMICLGSPAKPVRARIIKTD
jgi:putative colanic acid biosynthesis acetyltransferase WcaF